MAYSGIMGKVYDLFKGLRYIFELKYRLQLIEPADTLTPRLEGL
jgi:hypothetical protein